MSASQGKRLHVILYEGPGAGALSAPRKLDLLGSLLAAGCSVTLADCPCEISEAPGEALLVLGRFSKPMPACMPQPGGATLFFRDLGESNPEGLVELVRDAERQAPADPPGQWVPWFPVIDYERCTDCMQCLGFCLFGVYLAEGGKVRVANPANCKTNCPACARVCPEAAIIFPKCPERPINGADVRAEDLDGRKAGAEVAALLRGNIIEALRSRARERPADDAGKA